MATLEQTKALEIIGQKRRDAKNKKIKVAEYLSAGHAKYKTALNTFISIGALSVVSSCIGAIWATYGLATMLYQNISMTALDWTLAISEFVVYVITIFAGTKLYRLETTPTFALVSLIVLLILNASMFMGILPCFTVVFAIIGLFCWNTYKNWFDTIAKTVSRKEKISAPKLKEKKDPLDEKSESLNYLPWIISVVLLILIAISGSVGFYFLGKDQGKNDGYSSGYNSGKNAGYQNGFSNGESSGYNRGYNAGYDAGYSTGYNDMWNKAMCIVNGGGSRC